MLGHIGSRGTAWCNVTILDDLFDFDTIRVTSRRPESRTAFAARLSDHLGKQVEAVDSPEAAVAGADHHGGGVEADSRPRSALAHRLGGSRRARRSLRDGERGGALANVGDG